MNKAAQALGRLARGKPKTFTDEQIAAAKVRLENARRIRAQKIAENNPTNTT